MSNATIEGEILNRIELDPRISHAREIAVDVNGDVVTLRGTVGSFAERRAAVNQARGTDGVVDVFDDIKVRLMDDYMRADADIRGAALQSLIWDVEVPADLIDVSVEDGWGTLKGDVSFQFQSDDAFDDVASLTGVTGVTNKITVTEPM
jgi:osmotically-inducible protein OsmY